jgi:uncharacterized protein
MESELRSFWKKMFGYNWVFGIFLILFICVPRFILVLKANASGNYSYLGMIMVISAIIPFIFLNKYGLKGIGIVSPKKYYWVIIAFISGLIISIMLHILGQTLYGHSYENWYSYIGKSYNIPAGINQKDRLFLFAVMALTGMTFSPIGEELFFRGIVHSSFAKSIGDRKASVADSSAFALTHISHFGLVFINNHWNLLIIPALIWVLSLFLVSILFFVFKKKSGSLFGAIMCHSGFNLGMIYCIFYLM